MADDALRRLHESAKSLLPFDEFLKRVEEKRALLGEFFDAPTAALLVLREAGLDVERTPLRDLPERPVARVVAKVIHKAERRFQRPDGSTGLRVEMVLADPTGTARAVVWDPATPVQAGEDLRLLGVVRPGPAGVELSVREVEPAPEPVRIEPAPLSALRPGPVPLVRVRVLEVRPREFVRPDGARGGFRELRLAQGAVQIRGVAWENDLVLEPGASVEVENGEAKERAGQMELHLHARTRVRPSPGEVPAEAGPVPLDRLLPGTLCTVAGRVSGIGETREVAGRDGAPRRVATLHLSDGSGRVRVSLWGDRADLLPKLDVGTPLRITGGRVKAAPDGRPEIAAGEGTAVEVG
jgi:replication factor A1